MRIPDEPWARPWPEVLEALEVTREDGLTATEAAGRARRLGRNRLREPHRTGVVQVLVNQFRSAVFALLIAAAAVSVVLGDWLEGGAILAVIAISAAIGFATEWQAVRSMEALRQLERIVARVRRDGRVREIQADDLVPGDLVVLEGGDVVAADIRLIDASKLQADESLLTGESLPVAKQSDPVDRDAAVADRSCVLFKGTHVTRGSGEGVVVATGMRTEFGAIASLTEAAGAESTPLERRLATLGHRLIWVTLATVLVVAAGGVLAGRDVGLMIETSIALAVAAIPEGLPIVATLALARGLLRMARRHAIVQRLAAVETLGATSVICTDKTGTLTKNELTVSRLWLASGPVEVQAAEAARAGDDPEDPLRHRLLLIGVLCNNASLQQDGTAVGDPLEGALLRAGHTAGIARESALAVMPEVREEAFDATSMMMATLHESDGRVYVAVKGAPEAVLAACTTVAAAGGDRELTAEGREEWLGRVDEMAAGGLRVLAHADRTVEGADGNVLQALRLVGLVGFLDPPREDAAAAIDACRRAGIRVVMVTGDQSLTARSIARAVTLVDDGEVEVRRGEDVARLAEGGAMADEDLADVRVFARVTPGEKLDLIEAFQRRGHIVAMTGDGVNDAPALRKADIGVAMGRRGTQVAREAADMVLEDDALATIVEAVRQGRVIFDNIRRFVVYLLSCNLSEVLVIGSASVTTAPLPILPLQILFLNLVTDVFPALALGLGEGSDDVMRRPPRQASEQILMRGHWIAMSIWAVLITAAVLGAFALALLHFEMSETGAVTVSFLTLAFAQLWHVFNMRVRGSSPWRNAVVMNPWVWLALALCVGLLVAAVWVAPFARVLGVEPPGAEGWAVALGMSLLPALLGQLFLVRAQGQVPAVR